MKSVNYPILLICYLSLFVFGFVELSRGALYPQMLTAFGIGAGVGALFFTTSSFIGLLTNLSVKSWLGRFGQLKSLYLSLILYVFGATFLGLSSILGLWLQFVAAFFIGVGSTGIGITINILTAEAAPDELRGKALSGLHAMYALAALLVPLVISFGDIWEVGWDKYFYFAAVIAALIAAKTYSHVKVTPVLPKTPEEENRTFNWKTFLPYAFLFGFYVSGEVLTSTRLSFYLQKGASLSEDVSRSILFRYFLFFFLGRVAFIFINVKKYTMWVLQIALIFAITNFIAGIYFSPWYFPFAGLGMSVFFPLAMDMVSDRFPHEKESAVSFIFLFVGIMISTFHFSFGQIVEHSSLMFSILLIPTLHFICYLILLTLRKNRAPKVLV